MTDPVGSLVTFARALRSEGMAVGTGRVAEFSRAAALVGPADLYWAGRATLVSRPEELPVYDRVFRAHFGAVDEERRPEPVRIRVELAESEAALASQVELLKTKSFACCTEEELAELAGQMARIALAVPRRRTRRREAARAGTPDLRRTLRRSFRTGGELAALSFRGRRTRQRRLVLLLDVSGSMADYSRALLFFAHSAVRSDRRWEAFCFGTRLTRVTQALSTRDPDEALRRAAEEVVDWDGGTRIGESVKTFLDEFGHAGMARGAVVVICSDGLDVGEPALLAEQMERLGRLAHRVVWLNPLKEDPAYEPLARGMRAALPSIDLFASGHDLASLEAVAEAISGP
ncbi:MAG TPA: VWA domain-containing protein [Gaiellaceae bacterium]|nr:VWA domain-containing protein [Gaiellaceae bacterium]